MWDCLFAFQSFCFSFVAWFLRVAVVARKSDQDRNSNVRQLKRASLAREGHSAAHSGCKGRDLLSGWEPPSVSIHSSDYEGINAGSAHQVLKPCAPLILPIVEPENFRGRTSQALNHANPPTSPTCWRSQSYAGPPEPFRRSCAESHGPRLHTL